MIFTGKSGRNKSMGITPLAVVILAAGQGKRMANPDLPKVMVELAGKPMLGRVLEVVDALRPTRTIVIVGHHREMVIQYVVSHFGTAIEFAVQQEQLGTGHAVMQTEKLLQDFTGDVLILYGDVPLLKTKTLQDLVDHHRQQNRDISMMTAKVPDPKGYGRIIRNQAGEVVESVEERDATDEQKMITEINPCIYVVKAHKLFEALNHISSHNAQGEYYLTDIVKILSSEEEPIAAFVADTYKEVVGVNTPEELSRAEEILKEQ